LIDQKSEEAAAAQCANHLASRGGRATIDRRDSAAMPQLGGEVVHLRFVTLAMKNGERRVPGDGMSEPLPIAAVTGDPDRAFGLRKILRPSNVVVRARVSASSSAARESRPAFCRGDGTSSERFGDSAGVSDPETPR